VRRSERVANRPFGAGVGEERHDLDDEAEAARSRAVFVDMREEVGKGERGMSPFAERATLYDEHGRAEHDHLPFGDDAPRAAGKQVAADADAVGAPEILDRERRAHVEDRMGSGDPRSINV
jgi:hypothetical protein